jgi:putative addiction module killer protein
MGILVMEVIEYQTSSGRRPYLEWLERLRDSQGQAQIWNRIKRVRQGHLGDYRSVGNGVWELRIFSGPGYRVYFMRDGERLIILLCGGDKDSQTHDIQRAKTYAFDYWRRK